MLIILMKKNLIALKFSLTKWIILNFSNGSSFSRRVMEKIGYKQSLVSEQAWPKADLKFISDSNVNIVIQVNGKKKKLVLKIPKDLTIEETNELLMEKEDIKEIIGNNKLRKLLQYQIKFSV